MDKEMLAGLKLRCGMNQKQFVEAIYRKTVLQTPKSRQSLDKLVATLGAPNVEALAIEVAKENSKIH